MRKLPARTMPASLIFTPDSAAEPAWILFANVRAENHNVTPTTMGINAPATNTGNHSLLDSPEPELNSIGDTDRRGFSAR